MDYPGWVRQYHDTIRAPTRLSINCKGSKQGPDPELNETLKALGYIRAPGTAKPHPKIIVLECPWHSWPVPPVDENLKQRFEARSSEATLSCQLTVIIVMTCHNYTRCSHRRPRPSPHHP